MNNCRCLVQLDGGDGVFFLDNNGERTSDIQRSMIFDSELEAYIYIDKRGLYRLAKVRKIITDLKGK